MRRMLFGCALLLSLGTLPLHAAAVSGMPASTFLEPANSDDDGLIEEVFFVEAIADVQQVMVQAPLMFGVFGDNDFGTNMFVEEVDVQLIEVVPALAE